jgi:rhodanese-related sulfurtransferase
MNSNFKLLLLISLSFLGKVTGQDIRLISNPGLGIVPVGKSVAFQAFVENTSEVPLALLKVSSSCPCVTILDPEPFVERGKSGVVNLEYKPEKEGVSAVNIRLETNHPKTPSVNLQLTLTAASQETLQHKVLDPQHSISATELAILSKQNAAIIVDVRSPQEFAAFKIPGSINVPLPLLGKFPFPAGKVAVISGSGLNDGQLLSSLTKEKIKILRGGIRSWILSGQSIAGQLSKTRHQSGLVGFEQLARIEYQMMPMLLVAEQQANSLMPLGSLIVTTKDRLLEKLKELETRDSPILILAGQGVGYQEIEEMLPANCQNPVFYLKGGVEAFLKTQAPDAKSRQTMVISSGIRDGNTNTASSSRPGCNPCAEKAAGQKASAQ